MGAEVWSSLVWFLSLTDELVEAKKSSWLPRAESKPESGLGDLAAA
jgi:hypothetical protein